MHRIELKYFINARQKDLMANKLGKICRRDSYGDADGGYWISSLYFDDYHQSAFFDKVNGIRDRKKYRIRVYNHQPDVIKLERKIKRGTVTEKSHTRITQEECESLIRGDVFCLRRRDDAVSNDFYLHFRTKNLRPRVVVEYRREAFLYPYGDVRITFDTLLRAGVFGNDLFSHRFMISALPRDRMILEVKYTGYFPGVIRNVIQTDNLQWQSISKYATCCVVGL